MATTAIWPVRGWLDRVMNYAENPEKTVNPAWEQAELIGMELAQRLWGNRFEVVVSTHLNTGIMHNHFVLNSVSCVDGLRYPLNLSYLRVFGPMLMTSLLN